MNTDKFIGLDVHKDTIVAAIDAAYRREIITFLRLCKTRHVPATVVLAKQYVEQQERLRSGPVREALRWFCRAAKAAVRTRSR